MRACRTPRNEHTVDPAILESQCVDSHRVHHGMAVSRSRQKPPARRRHATRTHLGRLDQEGALAGAWTAQDGRELRQRVLQDVLGAEVDLGDDKKDGHLRYAQLSRVAAGGAPPAAGPRRAAHSCSRTRPLELARSCSYSRNSSQLRHHLRDRRRLGCFGAARKNNTLPRNLRKELSRHVR